MLDELLNFDGRLGRLEFFGFTLGLSVVSGIAAVIALLIIGIGGVVAFFGVVLLLGIFLFGFVANLSLYVRRLHDLNQSGKWAVLLFVPFL